MTLRVYAAPLHDMSPAEITTADVLAVLKPIWTTKPETASRVRGRIEMVLDYARALGHISEDKANVARWKGHLDNLLAKRSVSLAGIIGRCRSAEFPEFVAKLRDIDTTGTRALELIILTAARIERGSAHDEKRGRSRRRALDRTSDKNQIGRAHRVPLVARAIEIIREASAASNSDYHLRRPSPRAAPVSPRLSTMPLKRLAADVTVHGFRSSFADWRGDATHFSRELAEAALAHLIGDEVDAPTGAATRWNEGAR